MWKRCFALALATVLLTASIPIQTYATETTGSKTVSGGDAVSQENDEELIEASVALPDNSVSLMSTGDVMLTTTGSGSYVPYSGAKYSLAYTVTDDGVTIDGIDDYDTAENLGELVIPAEIDGVAVTRIKRAAFSGWKFENLTMGMKEIPENLFVGEYDPISGIDKNGAFEGCNFSGTLTLQDGVVTIGDYAFRDCDFFTGELVIPNSVESIGECAFEGCNGFLSDFTIPASVTTIGELAFHEFGSGISCITVLGNATSFSDYSISEGTFIYGYKNSTAESYAQNRHCTFIPLDGAPKVSEYRVSNTQELLDAIGSYGEGSYRHIILEDGVYELTNRLYLSNVVSLTLEADNPGKAEILSKNRNTPVIMISGCKDIEITGCILGHDAVEPGSCGTNGYVVELNNSFDVKIEKCDLYGCGVEAVRCGTVKNINLNYCILRDCMERIASGSGVEGLTFTNCTFSGNAYDESCAENYAALSFRGNVSLENCMFINNYSTKFSSDYYDSQQPGTISAEDCVFYDNEWDGETPKAYGICMNGITWQVVGDTLKIGYPLKLEDKNIVSAMGTVLPYSDASLPWKDFLDLKTDVAEGVVYVPNISSGSYIPYEGAKYRLSYSKTDDGIAIDGITDYDSKNNLGQLIIPEKINGVAVTSIGRAAFSGCTGFTGGLTIPDSVNSIGSYAFAECSGLKDITGWGSISELPEGIFAGCNGLTYINIPDSIQKVGTGAFASCNNLLEVAIGAGVQEVGEGAFTASDRVGKQTLIFLGNTTNIAGNAGGDIIYGNIGSTAQAYAENQGKTFRPLSLPEYKVSTPEELAAAIASNRRIILADGVYEVTEPLSINNIQNLFIVAENAGHAEIIADDASKAAVEIKNSENTGFVGCILGQASVPLAEGLQGTYTVKIDNSSEVRIAVGELYSSGSEAVMSLSSKDVELYNCVIRDCNMGIAVNDYGDTLTFEKCTIIGNGYDYRWVAALYGSKIQVKNCTFLNNYNTTFFLYDTVTLTDCVFYDNAWDGKTPKAYGICQNGITWQVDNNILKIGYPLTPEEGVTIESATGTVLSYSEDSLPWKKYQDLRTDVAEGVQYDAGKSMDIVIEGLDMKAGVAMSKEEETELIENVATEEEKLALEEGKSAVLELAIANAADTLEQEVKQKLEELAVEKKLEVGCYLDITMKMKVGELAERFVAETKAPVEIVLDVPESFRQADRVFSVIRLHDGVMDILKDLDENPDTVTIQTDRFSSYTLVYSDEEPLRKGDVNGDGVINVKDKRMVYNHIAGTALLEGDALQAADVNDDGVVNVKDKRMIYNHIAGTSLLW